MSTPRFAESGNCMLQSTSDHKNFSSCSHLKLDFEEPVIVNPLESILDISYSEGSISARTLESLRNVKRLRFYETNISRIEDGALGSLPDLTDLTINRGYFPTLTKGTLSNCQKIVIFHSSSPIYEQDALHDMTNLEVFSLAVRSPMRVSESFFEHCKKLRNIYIDGFESECRIEGNPFANLPRLEDLRFYRNTPIKHLTKDFFSGLPSLKTFQIWGPYVEFHIEIDTDAFEEIPHLRILKLSEVQLQDVDLVALHPLSKLVDLDLSKNRITTLDGLPALPNLESLNVAYCSISAFNFSDLVQKLPKLRNFNMVGNPLDEEFVSVINQDIGDIHVTLKEPTEHD